LSHKLRRKDGKEHRHWIWSNTAELVAGRRCSGTSTGQPIVAALNYLRGVQDWTKARMTDEPPEFLSPAWKRQARMMQRDRHLAMIAKHGRIGWQRRSGYNRRSWSDSDVSLQGHHRAATPGPNSAQSAGRGKIACNVLNRMTAHGHAHLRSDPLM
jgi:hypothetical protein